MQQLLPVNFAALLQRLLVYSTAGLFNFCLAVIYLLVPLYGIELGMAPLTIGALVALPALLTVFTSLVGGILSDRFGEKTLLVLGYGCMALAGIAYANATGFIPLLVGQALASVARAGFWAPSQAYVSRLSTGPSGRRLGWLSVAGNLGGVLGSGAAGYAALAFGYQGAFWSVAVLGLLACAMTIALPDLRRVSGGLSLGKLLQGFREVVQIRALYLGAICSFSAAVPVMLAGSFYPVYLNSVGFDAGVIGVITAFRAIGSVGATMLIGVALDRMRNHAGAYLAAFLVYAVAIGGTPFLHDPVALALVMTLAGVASAIHNLLYQVLTVQHTEERTRSAGFAWVGQFWALSQVVTPVAYGAAAESVGLAAAFVSTGVLALVAALTTGPTYRWLLRDAGHSSTRPLPMGRQST